MLVSTENDNFVENLIKNDDLIGLKFLNEEMKFIFKNNNVFFLHVFNFKTKNNNQVKINSFLP